jgi:hypothetical protein
MDAASLNQRLVNLSPAKKVLLELRLKQNRFHDQTIPPRRSRELTPLSLLSEKKDEDLAAVARDLEWWAMCRK